MHRFLISLALLMLVAGCGGGEGDRWTTDRPKTVPASGSVTLNGQPVEGATVNFAPQSPTGQAAFALTDSEGAFALGTFDQDDGAVPGIYTITISKKVVETVPNPQDPNGPPLKSEEKSLVPARYSSTGTTDLKATVSEDGENRFSFDLKN